jgi:hypothetical protein
MNLIDPQGLALPGFSNDDFRSAGEADEFWLPKKAAGLRLCLSEGARSVLSGWSQLK